MAAHTPGPWAVLNVKDRESDTGRALVIYDKKTGGGIAKATRHSGRPDDTEGNARLLALAPELLATLREVLDIGYFDEEVDETNPNLFANRVKARALAAIRMADGEG